MRIRRIILQNFRNIAMADVALSGRQHFFVGANAQGKTNLLEAVGFITALRSFRASDSKVLISDGQSEAAIACELEHERFGETRVTIRLRPGGKEVTCDNERVTRVAEYLGRFPTVVFSSQDQQWVRGSPAGRRRWLDLTLAAMDAEYLRALQAYHRALADRNALLKRGAAQNEIEAFEKPLASHAVVLVGKRFQGLEVLGKYLTERYAALADSAETAALVYEADAVATAESEFLERLNRTRARDLLTKTTSNGPHRDDFSLSLGGKAAKDYGSEGQQRSLVLALGLAQLSYFRDRSGVEPVLLADDVLGELDSVRRSRFWASLGDNRQVLATGTRLPEAELGAWQIFEVQKGSFAETKTTPR